MTLNPPAPINTRKGKGVTKRFAPAAEAASTQPKQKKRPKQGSDRVSNPPVLKKKGRPRGTGPPDLNKMGLAAMKGYAQDLGITDAPKDIRKTKAWADHIRTFLQLSRAGGFLVYVSRYVGGCILLIFCVRPQHIVCCVSVRAYCCCSCMQSHVHMFSGQGSSSKKRASWVCTLLVRSLNGV